MPGLWGLNSAAGSGSWGTKGWSCSWRAPCPQARPTPQLTLLKRAGVCRLCCSSITDVPALGSRLQLPFPAAGGDAPAASPGSAAPQGPAPPLGAGHPALSGARLRPGYSKGHYLHSLLRTLQGTLTAGHAHMRPFHPLFAAARQASTSPSFSTPNPCGDVIAWPHEAKE